jgi:hypothetical protein
MNISVNQPLTFTGARIPAKIAEEKMYTISRVRGLLENTSIYKEADAKKFDLYFLKPTRKNEIMRVIYYDRNMESFVRDDKGRILKTSAKSVNEPGPAKHAELAERVEATLYDVVHKRFKAPYWYYNPCKYEAEYKNICTKNDISP